MTTKWEKKLYEDMEAIRRCASEQGISMAELTRLAKKMCRCGTCHFFEQHYTKDGQALDWGHCFKGNVQHSKKQSTAAGGFWADGEEAE